MVMQKGIRDRRWEQNGQHQQGQLGLCSCIGRWILGYGGRDCLGRALHKSQCCSYLKSETT